MRETDNRATEHTQNDDSGNTRKETKRKHTQTQKRKTATQKKEEPKTQKNTETGKQAHERHAERTSPAPQRQHNPGRFNVGRGKDAGQTENPLTLFDSVGRIQH